ncbi:DUF721 domain-containing protein [Legionella londiniensis]|uniref:DUF721 domain-containing protein n=2 Tax=Legionella londiniensis TaxID=45068 RepID=A0A0W0VQU3_9GAMM|nr:DUF721 domain-containing protein [Legionella londiniensis]KTD22528.1 hypothetical protein Llon_0402 [Legionella londiniensis]STX92459.1 Zn-ribbon-containing, possible RNA-binding protein-like protein [Legionella londiniensis]
MRRINRCLNPRLADICQNALYLDELNQKVLQFLPESFRAQVKVGSYNKGKLVLIASNQEWASQLRYILPELRDKLRVDGKIYHLTTIQLKLDAEPSSPLPKQKPTTIISDKARQTIEILGRQCTYKPLQDALMRLAGYKDKS